MRSFLPFACSLVILMGCATGTDPLAPTPDGDEAYLREASALVTGSSTINGSVVTDPNYDDQPSLTAVSGRLNDLIFFTQKAKMSGSTMPTLAASFAGATTDYGFVTQPANFANSYEVRLLTKTEPVFLNLWNSATVSGPLNQLAAIWEYSIKTAPRFSTDEPDSDNVTATVSDRTMANTIPLDTTINRSMFNYSGTNRDVEEWWKASLLAQTTYKVDVSTYNPRFGTWKYRIQVRNPDGTVLSSGAEIQTTETSATFNFTTQTAGTHYIQIAGFHKTKTASSNVFYSPYSIKLSPAFSGGVSQLVGSNENTSTYPRAVIVDGNGNSILVGDFRGIVDFDPGVGTQIRDGGSTADGFCLSLSPTGAFQWVATLPGGPILPFAVTLDASGAPRITGAFSGTTDFDPGPGTQNRTTGGGSAFCLALTAAGAYQWVSIAHSSGLNHSASGYTIVQPTPGDIRIAGNFHDTIDFDPGPGTSFLTSDSGAGFVWALDSGGGLQWVGRLGSEDSGSVTSAVSVVCDASGNLTLTGGWTGTADFDPSASTQERVSAGMSDAYCVRLNLNGTYVWVATASGTGDSSGNSTALLADGRPVVVGKFDGVVDFDPGIGVVNRTALGVSDAYYWQLQTSGAYSTVATWGGIGAELNPADFGRTVISDGSSNTILVGEFEGTADFNPGAGTSLATSSGQQDAYCLSLDSNGNFRWAAFVQGPAIEDAYSVGLRANGMPVISGAFNDTADFNSSTGDYPLTAGGNRDGYLLSLTPTGTW